MYGGGILATQIPVKVKDKKIWQKSLYSIICIALNFPLAARMFYLEGTRTSSDRGEDRVGHSFATAKHFLAFNFKVDCCCSSDVLHSVSNLHHDPQETTEK